jgi:DNA invertase Pin-like site-specific DNA recombinase
MEDFVEKAIGILDEYYQAALSAQARRRAYNNARKHQTNGGVPPFGYKIVAKKYAIDEDSASIVREIFTKYADGMSIRQICEDLKNRNITTSCGRAFNRESLRTVLKNRRYTGVYIYGTFEEEGGMPRIIEDELFYKVNPSNEQSANLQTPEPSQDLEKWRRK